MRAIKVALIMSMLRNTQSEDMPKAVNAVNQKTLVKTTLNVSGINPQGFMLRYGNEANFSCFLTFQTLKCSISQNV